MQFTANLSGAAGLLLWGATRPRSRASKGVADDPKWRLTILNHHAAATESWSEAEAIERAKQGGAEAFEFLYHLHRRRVYSLCLRMTGNTAEAEDLSQEAFLQLFRKIGTFRGESAFSTWLHRLSVNVVLMHLRRKNLPETPLEELTEPSQEDGPRREIGARDPTLAGSIDRVNLERAIERLPPGYRTIFVLHDMEGYEHNEIADMMNCSIGNSKSQLHKARMKLRDLLQMPFMTRPGAKGEIKGEARGAARGAARASAGGGTGSEGGES